MGLIGRVLDKLRDWFDKIAEALGGDAQPQPQHQPIPVPVRDRMPRRY
ncbi:MAG: hypothetical protein AB4050_10310 [Synechococcus sp.]